MTRRKLRPDEISLWRQVTDTTDRLHPERVHQNLPLPKPKPHKPVLPRLPEFSLGQAARNRPVGHMLAPTRSETLATAQINMDKKAFTRLKRGKLKPEGRIDLHGMTLDQAHPALTRFILSSQASHKRLVLVITGKGKQGDDHGPIPVRRGILKHNVPQWLRMAPLSQAILQISEAHLKHGGGGAYYVYLRRNR